MSCSPGFSRFFFGLPRCPLDFPDFFVHGYGCISVCTYMAPPSVQSVTQRIGDLTLSGIRLHAALGLWLFPRFFATVAQMSVKHPCFRYFGVNVSVPVAPLRCHGGA